MTDPYVYPGTSVLRNLRGIRDQSELERFESLATTLRINQLNTGEVRVHGEFDLNHLRALHRHIFRDVYDWAGELRSVELGKDGSLFCRTEYLESSADDLFRALEEDDFLRGRRRDTFLTGAAHALVELNALHPFREGNGRAQRALLSELGLVAGWPIDWTGLEREMNIEASRRGHAGDEKTMLGLLEALVTPAGQSFKNVESYYVEQDFLDATHDFPELDVEM